MRPIWEPAAFQSRKRSGAFFEGWYIKLVSADRTERLALIPGISKTDQDQFAFLQIYDGLRLTYHFFRYPFHSFEADKKRFSFCIGENFFHRDTVRLEHHEEGIHCSGKIDFATLRPWPVKFLSPGAMGWYGLLPFMEDYHAVLSMDSPVDGRIQLGDLLYNFDGGRSYIEKDWGCSFPSAWIWLQCNHFSEEGISLSFSLARVPWKRHWFSGFIIGLLLHGRFYRFCTYTGAVFEKLEKNHTGGFTASIRKKKMVLEIEAEDGNKTRLKAPKLGAMKASVEESLSARCRIRLKKRGKLIYEGKGDCAGLEMAGEPEELLPRS